MNMYLIAICTTFPNTPGHWSEKLVVSPQSHDIGWATLLFGMLKTVFKLLWEMRLVAYFF